MQLGRSVDKITSPRGGVPTEREVSDTSLPIRPPSWYGEAPIGAVRAGGVGCSVNRQVVIMTILIKENN
jgi:hypothetical protein